MTNDYQTRRLCQYMNLQRISSTDGGFHTINTDLLTIGGWTLDAGARDFTFSDALRALGQEVIAIDPAPDVTQGKRDLIYLRAALDLRSGFRLFHVDSDPMSSRITTVVGQNFPLIYAMTVEDVMCAYRVQCFDCVKLDIEGAEFDVLAGWPGPIARQISVEYHDRLHNRFTRKDCALRLSRWYTPVFESTDDTLYVLKEI